MWTARNCLSPLPEHFHLDDSLVLRLLELPGFLPELLRLIGFCQCPASGQRRSVDRDAERKDLLPSLWDPAKAPGGQDKRLQFGLFGSPPPLPIFAVPDKKGHAWHQQSLN